MKRWHGRIVAVMAALGECLAAGAVQAQQALVIKPLAEKKVSELPAGDIYWRIENFATREQASAAAGPWSLVTEAEGKVWMFTLGAAGASTSGGAKAAEVGPIPRVAASQYLLRINEASGPAGAVTAIHSNPGSEGVFVLSGEQSIRGAHGTQVVHAGQPEAGHGADMAMQVSSSGATDLRSLVMFVVDAARPFSSPATLP